MKKSFLFLFVMLLNVLALSSCSKDDEEGANGSFTVNGDKYRLESEQCIDGIVDDIEGIFVAAQFSAALNSGPDTYYFTLRLGAQPNFNSLKVGDDISDIVWIRSYRHYTDFSEEDFDDDISGKLIVKSISGSAITLEFVEFTFIKKLRGTYTKTYVMNGTITFERLVR